MSETWFVYVDRDARDSLAVADACNDAVAAWLDEHDGGVEDRVAELPQRYAALLMENGTLDDARAAKALGVDRAVLEAAAGDLDRALAEIDDV
jgi:hypothetical protein